MGESAGRPTADSAARANLRRLAWLRLLVLGALLGATLLTARVMAVPLAAGPLLIIALALAALSGSALWRCRHAAAVGETGLAIQLALDIAALSAIFHFSSGAASPFVSLYLVPLVVAAAILPRAQVLALALLACVAYTALLGEYAPTRHHPHAAGSEFDLHVLGMWGNFVVTAGIIGFNIVGMAAALRERERDLARARESALRDEQVVGLATLAAGAAHELGTPLSTMAVLCRELELDCADRPELQEDLRLLRAQVAICKDIIQRMLSRNPIDAAEAPAIGLDEFLAQIIDSWALMRPRTRLDYHSAPAGLPATASQAGNAASAAFAIPVRRDPALAQALINVLNNAADASPEGIEVASRIVAGQLQLEVRDRGAGIDASVEGELGRAGFSTKRDGNGLGLFLTRAMLERLGGSLQLVNHPGGGAATSIRVPLSALRSADA